MKLIELRPKARRNGGRKPYRTILLVDLRALRVKRGISLTQASRASGVPSACLAKIELGQVPSFHNAYQIASFVDLPIEKIWAVRKGAA